MFALRKIVDGVLYTLAIEEDDTDEMSLCMSRWSDTNYLFSFFKTHEHVLKYYKMSRSEAIELITEQSDALFNQLRNASKSEGFRSSLDNLFRPLHTSDDFSIPIVETKAYSHSKGKPRMLRLYAVRIKDGTYIFVGGLIKTTQALQESAEGNALLKKMKSFTDYLREQGYTDSHEIGELLF